MVKYFISFFLLFLLQSSFAQPSRQYTFTHLTKLSGLASNFVSAVAQDSQGFIWIGTSSGLQRFDGSRFITFRPDQSNAQSIPVDHIHQLMIDRNNQLWILFAGGKVGVFDTRKFTYRPADVEVDDPNILNAEKRLFQDTEGNMMIHFAGLTLLTYNKPSNTFSSKYTFIKAPPKWTIFYISCDRTSKNIYLGCDSGLAVFNSITRQLSYRGHNEEKLPLIKDFGSLQHTSRLFVDSRRRLWFTIWKPFGPAPMVYCYDQEARRPLLMDYNLTGDIKTYFEVHQPFEQRTGRIWLGGLMVLAEFNEKLNRFENVYNGFVHEQGIQYKIIKCLYEDSEQNLWIATDNNGLYVFNPSAQLFRNVRQINRRTKQPGDGSVLSFFGMRDGSIMMGAWGDGLYRYDSLFNSVTVNMPGISENNAISVWDMHERKNGELWMALQPGILVYDQKKGTSKTFHPPIFLKRTIRQLVEDPYGNMWLGTQSRGLFKWTASKAKKRFEDGFSHFSGIPQTLIYKLYVDSKGYLWVGTIADGVYKIRTRDGVIVEHITKNGVINKELLDNAVSDIVELNDSTMVFSAGGLNIYHTRRNEFKYLTTHDGLPSNVVVSMEKDKTGHLWLGLLNGLCRVDIAKKTFLLYDRNDGIVNDNFNVAATLRLPDGRMLFGTSNNFVVFDPEELIMEKAPPDVAITGFELSNKALPVDSLQRLKKIRLRHDNNAIQIDFASLSYLKKNKISYEYMLEGLDKDWITADNHHRAVYNYLPPGDYEFKVRGQNPGGVSSPNITTLAIRVNRPFWKSWWFYVIIALVVIFVLYRIDRERTKRLFTLEKIRTQIADNLHQDITTTLNQINLLSEMARLKADKDISRSKEYIEQISEKSHNMIIAMDDMLWSIDPENDNMEQTLLRMDEYIEALKKRENARIELEVGEKVKSVKLDMTARHEAFIIFKELLRKAVDQANGHPVLIHLDLYKSNLAFKIQSNSNGENRMYNEFGLPDLRKRADSINAVLDIHKNKGESFATLQVPLR